jgi:hypothetical protein
MVQSGSIGIFAISEIIRTGSRSPVVVRENHPPQGIERYRFLQCKLSARTVQPTHHELIIVERLWHGHQSVGIADDAVLADSTGMASVVCGPKPPSGDGNAEPERGRTVFALGTYADVHLRTERPDGRQANAEVAGVLGTRERLEDLCKFISRDG